MYEYLCWMYLPCMNCKMCTAFTPRRTLIQRTVGVVCIYAQMKSGLNMKSWNGGGQRIYSFDLITYTKMECIILQNKAVPFWPLGWTFMMTMATTTTNKKKEKTMSVYEKATFHHHLQQRVYCQSCHFQKKILFCTAGSIRSKRVVVYIQ